MFYEERKKTRKIKTKSGEKKETNKKKEKRKVSPFFLFFCSPLHLAWLLHNSTLFSPSFHILKASPFYFNTFHSSPGYKKKQLPFIAFSTLLQTCFSPPAPISSPPFPISAPILQIPQSRFLCWYNNANFSCLLARRERENARRRWC